jgi:hypothetical protein
MGGGYMHGLPNIWHTFAFVLSPARFLAFVDKNEIKIYPTGNNANTGYNSGCTPYLWVAKTKNIGYLNSFPQFG